MKTAKPAAPTEAANRRHRAFTLVALVVGIALALLPERCSGTASAAVDPPPQTVSIPSAPHIVTGR